MRRTHLKALRPPAADSFSDSMQAGGHQFFKGQGAAGDTQRPWISGNLFVMRVVGTPPMHKLSEISSIMIHGIYSSQYIPHTTLQLHQK